MTTTKPASIKSSRMFLIKKNKNGLALLKAMKKTLNSQYYDIKVRGRGRNRRQLGTSSTLDLSIDNSEYLAIYIIAKKSIRMTDRNYLKDQLRNEISREAENE